MNDPKDKYVEPDWVFAMIHTMIEESIYHTETFAHTLKVHHNDKAAKVFHLICAQFKEEQKIVLEHVLHVDLPNIPPWEVPYEGYHHPSSVLINANYLMTESEAWRLMHDMIEIHNGFYRFLVEGHKEESICSVIDKLAAYCQKCGQKNKKMEAKADTKHRKSVEDLDVIALHSSEGGLW